MIFSPTINFIIVLVSGGLVWLSGTYLAVHANWISVRFKIGQAFVGAFLLAFVTSLPELATTITASILGNAPLVISNLLGGINMQTVVLALADLILIRKSLTFLAPRPSLLVGGVFVILQLSIATIGVVHGELFSLWGIGFWPFLLFVTYILMLYFVFHHEENIKWIHTDAFKKMRGSMVIPTKQRFSNTRLITFFILNTLIVLIAGSAISYFADKLIVQWNWSGSWMGATVVALFTSLPEISTTFSAIRQKAYAMAISNIFGSNVFTIALLFPAEFFFRKGPIMNEAVSADLLLIGIGVFITGVFLWGILNRQKRTFFRMGLDSLIVLVSYALFMWMFYVYSN